MNFKNTSCVQFNDIALPISCGYRSSGYRLLGDLDPAGYVARGCWLVQVQAKSNSPEVTHRRSSFHCSRLSNHSARRSELPHLCQLCPDRSVDLFGRGLLKLRL